jgi:hypothetical protein
LSPSIFGESLQGNTAVDVKRKPEKKTTRESFELKVLTDPRVFEGIPLIFVGHRIESFPRSKKNLLCEMMLPKRADA